MLGRGLGGGGGRDDDHSKLKPSRLQRRQRAQRLRDGAVVVALVLLSLFVGVLWGRSAARRVASSVGPGPGTVSAGGLAATQPRFSADGRSFSDAQSPTPNLWHYAGCKVESPGVLAAVGDWGSDEARVLPTAVPPLPTSVGAGDGRAKGARLADGDGHAAARARAATAAVASSTAPWARSALDCALALPPASGFNLVGIQAGRCFACAGCDGPRSAHSRAADAGGACGRTTGPSSAGRVLIFKMGGTARRGGAAGARVAVPAARPGTGAPFFDWSAPQPLPPFLPPGFVATWAGGFGDGAVDAANSGALGAAARWGVQEMRSGAATYFGGAPPPPGYGRATGLWNGSTATGGGAAGHADGGLPPTLAVQPGGSLLMDNSYIASANVVTPQGPTQSWSGAAFGPGYFEAYISMPATTLINARQKGVHGCMLADECWPSFRLASFERSLAMLNPPHRPDPAAAAAAAAAAALSQGVPGAAVRAYASSVLTAPPHAGWPLFAGLNVMEAGADTSGNAYSATAHSWAGGGVHGPAAEVPGGRRAAHKEGALTHVAAYGVLWTAATPASDGSAAFFFNRRPVEGGNVTWGYVDCGALTPAVAATLGPWQVMDCQHFVIVLNTGPDMPMTVYNVSVYQPDTSGNVYSWA